MHRKITSIAMSRDDITVNMVVYIYPLHCLESKHRLNPMGCVWYLSCPNTQQAENRIFESSPFLQPTFEWLISSRIATTQRLRRHTASGEREPSNDSRYDFTICTLPTWHG